jgi:glycosyltransferase involved in cell wall biosynthesis
MKLSIVTINRNNADGLERTILSVLRQDDRSSLEYIVIDGASTDGSVDVLHRYADRLDYSLSEPDRGIYNAMNKALPHVHGDYVLFLNSGDTLASPTVVREVCARAFTTDFVFGCWNRVQGDKVMSHQEPPQWVTLYEMQYRSECVCHQATFTRTQVLRDLGGYDERLRLAGDICFLMRALVLERKTQSSIPTTVCHFDTSGASRTGTAILMAEQPAYFRELFPALADDYAWMYRVRRFTPKRIWRHILWLIRGNNY